MQVEKCVVCDRYVLSFCRMFLVLVGPMVFVSSDHDRIS